MRPTLLQEDSGLRSLDGNCKTRSSIYACFKPVSYVGRAQAAQLREVQIHANRTEISLVAQLVGVRNEPALANQVLAQQHEAHNDLQRDNPICNFVGS